MAIDERAARIASNEVRFREINETLASGLRRLPTRPESPSFICECGNRDCSEMVSVSLDEYASVRADARHFLLVPGHELPEFERVIGDDVRYAVVEKFEETVPIVEATDPRPPSAS